MDHDTLPKPQFELPRPQVKPGQEGLAPLENGQDIPQQTELRNTELPAAPAPVTPGQAAQSVTAAAPQGAAGLISSIAPAQAPTINDDDLAAEDGELIEKSWVIKAKAIVEQTKNDPHKQNAEINKVKKEYIQKRYHKDVKLNEE